MEHPKDHSQDTIIPHSVSTSNQVFEILQSLIYIENQLLTAYIHTYFFISIYHSA